MANPAAVKEFVESQWEGTIQPTLFEYIKIPNQSPLFDPAWQTNGHLQRATDLLADWARGQDVPGATVEVIQEKDRTPLIFIEVPATDRTDQTVLLYGHLDKQPPMPEQWEAGLGPFTPVIRDGKLYGRGGADDGYAIFGAITAIKALKAQGIPHARCVIVIEACEESGSPDLEFYINKLADRIGTPSLVVCLDSGSGNYEQFWMTSSLRGLVVVNLRVKVMTEGQHSGASSGVVVETTRVLRQLLDRVEDSKTGQILLPEFHCDIPPKFAQYAQEEAKAVGDETFKKFPMLPGVQPASSDLAELCLNRTWRPTLCITGCDGIPSLANAGNVLRPETAVKLSMRVPPGVDAKKARDALSAVLKKDPPYGMHVLVEGEKAGAGWAAPELAPWLEESVQKASNAYYGKPALRIGEGGSIPFMGMLAARFPGVQFVITGVLGPNSNAHAPNEFLHINFTKNVICCVASILADHHRHTAPGAANKKLKQ